MTKKEFEDLTGRKIGADEYARIEGVYLAGTLDKETFAKDWVTAKRDRIIDDLALIQRKQEAAIRESTGIIKRQKEDMHSAAEKMLDCSAAIQDFGDLKRGAIKLVGIDEVIRIELKKNLPVGAPEKQRLAEIMGL